MHRLRFFHYTFLIVIISVGVYLRIINLNHNPAWYTDEATHINIASNLLNGETRYLAIESSWLIFARLPLFEYLLAATFAIFGADMLALRGLTVALNILSIVLLYGMMHDLTEDRWLAALCSGCFALMPQAIVLSRLGFSYHLLVPMLVIAMWFAGRYQRHEQWRDLLGCSLLIGLMLISDFIAWGFLLSLVFVTGRSWRRTLIAVSFALMPLLIYFGFAWLSDSQSFLFDLNYTLSRLQGGGWQAQIGRILGNYDVLIREPYWLVGIIGFFLLKDRHLLFIFLAPLILIARTVPLVSLSSYYLIPFLPIIAIGLGGFLREGWRYSLYHLPPSVWVIAILLLSSPFLWQTQQLLEQVHSQIRTPMDGFLIAADDAYAVADYLNANRQANDVVIASAPIAWLLDGNVADFQMAVTAEGQDAIHLPHDLPLERYAFDAGFSDARYWVVDDLWRAWGAVHIPRIADIIQQTAQMQPIFQSGSIMVYVNPVLP